MQRILCWNSIVIVFNPFRILNVTVTFKILNGLKQRNDGCTSSSNRTSFRVRGLDPRHRVRFRIQIVRRAGLEHPSRVHQELTVEPPRHYTGLRPLSGVQADDSVQLLERVIYSVTVIMEGPADPAPAWCYAFKHDARNSYSGLGIRRSLTHRGRIDTPIFHAMINRISEYQNSSIKTSSTHASPPVFDSIKEIIILRPEQ